MVRAAKIFFFLVKVRMQASTIFIIALLHRYVAMKNGRFNMANTVAVSMFENISFWGPSA